MKTKTTYDSGVEGRDKRFQFILEVEKDEKEEDGDGWNSLIFKNG